MQQSKNCPFCENHCDEESIRCGRGAAFFGKEEKHSHHRMEEPANDVITCLRKCGHYLHHNHSLNESALTECLTEEEKNELCALLNKCLQNWGSGH